MYGAVRNNKLTGKMVGSSAWQWTGGVGGHGGSGKERKEGDGMETTRDKLQVEEYVGLLQCV